MIIVITGSEGLIGQELVREFNDHEVRKIDRRSSDDETIVANLARESSAAEWQKAFIGADVVIHLAEDPNHKTMSWQQALYNIQSTWNVFNAAITHKVRRIVYASSTWAVKSSGQPINLYGVAKVTGETLGATLVSRQELDSFFALRIGRFQPSILQDDPVNEDHLYVSSRDLREMFRASVETEEKEFAGFNVMFVISDHVGSPFNMNTTRALLGRKWSDDK